MVFVRKSNLAGARHAGTRKRVIGLPVWLAMFATLMPLASAQARETDRVIPLHDEAGGAMSIEASIDGQRGIFLFDSGWGVSALSPVMADRVGCRPWGQLTGFRAIGERVDMRQCRPATIVLGDQRIRLPTLVYVDIQRFMPPGSPVYGGGLGLDMFAGRIVTLRARARQIVLESPASLEKRIAHARPIPIRLVREVQGAALTVDVGVPTPQGMLWMELDTGNSGPTMIARHAAALVGLKPDQELGQNVSMTIVPGAVVQGPALVRDLIMDGKIGLDFLRRWDLTLDLDRGRAWLAPSDGIGRKVRD